jgi:hypothetical protein
MGQDNSSTRFIALSNMFRSSIVTQIAEELLAGKRTLSPIFSPELDTDVLI